jgi:hypothetical protein
MYDNTASNVTNMYRKGKYKCLGQKVDFVEQKLFLWNLLYSK